MPAKLFWVKAIGSAAAPLSDPWVEPTWDTECALPARIRKPSLKIGDVLVYYAAGYRRLFAAVEVASEPFTNLAPHARAWPWRVQVKPLVNRITQAPLMTNRPGQGILIDPFYSLRGVSLNKAIMRQSHIRISPEQAEAMLRSLEEAFR